MLKNRLFLYNKLTKCTRFASSSIAELENEADLKEFRKTAVTAVNANTNDRSIVQIEPKTRVMKRFRREFNLPQKAIDGLRNALITCERSTKQLQNEADQLTNKLEQRRFPESPEKLKAVRDEVKRKLEMSRKNDDDGSEKELNEAFGGKIKEAQNYQLKNEVDKILKKASYNWRPLEITTKEAAAAYSLSRLAPNYAEISRVLEEFNAMPDFQPTTLLDYGSGSGAGFWAATNYWKELKEVTMVDLSDAMTRFSMDSMRKEKSSIPGMDDGKPFVHDNINFRRHLVPSANTTYDVVLAHRILCEIGSSETRIQLIESLWKRTNRFLILIESGQIGAFGGILEARDYLLSSGTTVDYRKLVDILQAKQMLSQEILDVFENDRLSDYEKFVILTEMLPESIEIPTVVPTATVFAPCPHDLGCPMGVKSACTFSTRFQPIRADGKRSERESDGSEVSKFTFMILEKGNRTPNTHTDRIMVNRKLGGHVTCDVCTAFRGIQRITLSKKKHGNMYTELRSRRDGDVLPLKLKTVATEGIFDVSLRE